MTLFLLHENTERQDDKNLICLPDRFNWFAFVLPPIWALSNKLWFNFLAMILYVLASTLVGEFLILPTLALYVLAVVWLGFEANAILGKSYARRGWRALNPVVATNRLGAERRYFGRTRRWAARINREKSRLQYGNQKQNDVAKTEPAEQRDSGE